MAGLRKGTNPQPQLLLSPWGALLALPHVLLPQKCSAKRSPSPVFPSAAPAAAGMLSFVWGGLFIATMN